MSNTHQTPTQTWEEWDNQRKLDVAKWLLGAIMLVVAFMAIFLAVMLLPSYQKSAFAAEINLNIIAQIESSGCLEKEGHFEHAVGCFQITQPVLTEWNKFKKQNLKMSDLMDDAINRRVAEWYLRERIPQMIRYFGKPVTVKNILIAYNAGISYVKNDKPLPLLTQKYLQKYRSLGGNS